MYKQIGKYEVQEEIGKGGFGTVYRAYDPVVGREVAIKVLTALGSEDMLRRFRAEAKATGNLHHPNIVTVHDYGEQDGVPYIVMEFLRGRNLDLLISESSLSLVEKVEIMSQVAEGLHYAHGQGVVHRDVKPANLMLLNSGLVKIMDFGIARIMTENSTRYTKTGFLVGSVPYMSPERFGESTVVDALSDVWAVGVVYYELLSGRRPFVAEDIGNLVFQINRAEPPPLAALVKECPPELQRIVTRALAKNRDLRYGSLNDFRGDNHLVLLDLKRSSAGRMLDEARRLYSARDLRGAQVLARRVLELDPRNEQARKLRDYIQTQIEVQVLLKQADDLIAQGHHGEAASVLESARRLSPEEGAIATRLQQARVFEERKETVRKLLAAAQEQFRVNEIPGALRSLEEALQLEPGNEEAARLAQLYGHEAERREALRQGLAEAQQLHGRQMYTEALETLRRLEAQCPSSPEVAQLRAQVESEQRTRKRQQRLEQTLSHASRFIREGHFSQAAACLEPLLGEFAGERELERLYSFAVLQKEAKAKSDAIALIVAKARSLVESGQYADAIAGIENALKQFPGEAELQEELSVAIEMLAECERQLALESEVDRARAAMAGKRLDEAREIVRHALGQFGEEPALISLAQEIEQEAHLAHKDAELKRIQKSVGELLRASKTQEAMEQVAGLLAQYPEDPILTALLRECQEFKKKQETEDIRRTNSPRPVTQRPVRVPAQLPGAVPVKDIHPRRTAGWWMGITVLAVALLGGLFVLWLLIKPQSEGPKTSGPNVVIEEPPPGAIPAIGLSADSLQFEWRVGGAAPEPQLVSVASSGEAVSFTVSGADEVVRADPEAGRTPQTLTVRVTPSGISAGDHRRVLTISGGSVSRQLSLELRVLPAVAAPAPGVPKPKPEVKPAQVLPPKEEPKQQTPETSPPPQQPKTAPSTTPDLTPTSRLPAPRPTLSLEGYLGRLRGELTWIGTLPGNAVLTIQGGEASSGQISGDDLPRVPVSVEAGGGFVIVEAPGASNNWDRLVVRNTSGNALPRLRIQWRVLR